MNSQTVFPWLITIVVTLFTILLFWLGWKRKQRKTLSKLKNFATENNCTLNEFDCWDKSLIGLDKTGGGKLFFIRKSPGIKSKIIIHLLDIKRCNLIKTERTEKVGRIKISIIDRIQLILTPKNLHNEEISLEFYNTDFDSLTLTGELQLAEKWNKLINDSLNNEINVDETLNIASGKIKITG